MLRGGRQRDLRCGPRRRALNFSNKARGLSLVRKRVSAPSPATRKVGSVRFERALCAAQGGKPVVSQECTGGAHLFGPHFDLQEVESLKPSNTFRTFFFSAHGREGRSRWDLYLPRAGGRAEQWSLLVATELNSFGKKTSVAKPFRVGCRKYDWCGFGIRREYSPMLMYTSHGSIYPHHAF